MNNYSEQDEYPSLKTISSIFKILAIIILLAAIVGLIYGIVLMGERNEFDKTSGMTLLIDSVAIGIIIPLLFFAFAELIHLFIKMELNTRQIIANKNETINSGQQSQIKSSNADQSGYEEWKKDNPKVSLNDFYATKKKRT